MEGETIYLFVWVLYVKSICFSVMSVGNLPGLNQY